MQDPLHAVLVIALVFTLVAFVGTALMLASKAETRVHDVGNWLALFGYIGLVPSAALMFGLVSLLNGIVKVQTTYFPAP